MLIKTLLNKVENFKLFVYKAVYFEVIKGKEARELDYENPKDQPGTNEESGKDVAETQASDSQLVQGRWETFFRYG